MVKLIQERFSRIIAPFSLHHHNGFTLGSLSYKKLPGQLLQISILKLDGSSFNVHVSKNATVGNLEFAVEAVYGVLPEGEGNILWSLIWSHFCLCYEGQKLINEKACLESYGIKDGDEAFIKQLPNIKQTKCSFGMEKWVMSQYKCLQLSLNVCTDKGKFHRCYSELRFSRHMRIDHKPARQQSENHFVVSEHHSPSNACDARADDHASIEEQESDLWHFNCEQDLAVPKKKFNLPHFFKRWLSRLKLHGLRRGRGYTSL